MFHVPEKYRLRRGLSPVLGSDPSYGNNGIFIIPHFRITGYEIRVMASDGAVGDRGTVEPGMEMPPSALAWEHASVTIAPLKGKASRCPAWEEMCWIKGKFWDEEDCVIQYHPPQSENVSMHDFCLHLWRPVGVTFPVPDSIMVGVKSKGATNEAH